MIDARILTVIDLAYQAATDQALWAPTLEALVDVMGGSAGSLMWHGPVSPGGVTVGADPDALRQYFDHYRAINPIQIGFDRMRMADWVERPVMTDRACVARETLVAGEYFNDFMRPREIGSVMLITGAEFLFEGSAPAFNVSRSNKAEEFDAAALEIAAILQKPLHRAFQMSRQLARDRRLNESLGEFVEQLAGAVLMVEGDGRIVHANPAAEAMLALRDGLFSEGGKLRASSADVQRSLAALLASAAMAESGRRRGGSLPAPRPSGRRALGLLATPTRGGGGPLADKPLVLLSVVDPERGEPDAHERLRAYFGFTPAEARVAAEMMAGYDVREIADRLGRSIHTVRLQVAQVREKTETSRQGESIAVMLRMLGIGGRGV